MDRQETRRGYQRCSRIDYSNPANAFELTICVSPRRPVFVSPEMNSTIVEKMRALQETGVWGVYAYCLMPDLIHLIISPGRDGLPQAIRLFKGGLTPWWRMLLIILGRE